VERTETLDGLSEGALDYLLVGHVAGERKQLFVAHPGRPGDFGGGLLDAFFAT
jgi:hypothetical protein